MIRTVIFDIGNVLADFDWDRFVRAQIPDEALRTRMNRTFTEQFWALWAEFDRGVLSEDMVTKRIVAEAPEFEAEIRQLLDRVDGCIFPLDYAIPWVRSLKAQGLSVLYLSNYSEKLRKANPDALSFLPEMDGGVFSYEVKLLKPDPAIYQCICEKYGLVPEETVFLDDMPANVDAAAEFGLQAIRFLNYEDAKEKLEQMLH